MIGTKRGTAEDGLKRAARLVGLVAIAASLSGCASMMRPTQKAFAPDEYDVRHPIRIAETPAHLDVFATGHSLDRRQHADIVAFARDYARHGRSGITAAVPQGNRGGVSLAAIQQALAEGGAAGRLHVVPYAADVSRGAAPVRLSYMKLQAKVDSQCGLWPVDLASGGKLETWHNRPHHNLGCSYQTMIAAQVADPIDLVRPRAEGPIDVGKRTRDIEALRKGEDPSTKWQKDDVKVKDSQQ
jgi:pilus assembly protein CpaD